MNAGLSGRHWKVLLIILGVSVALRVLIAIAFGDTVVKLPGSFDQISYHRLALRVAAGNGFSFGREWWPTTPAGAPTAFWSYLYTLFLTSIYKVFGPSPMLARLIQAVVVGIFQPLLAYLIGRKLVDERVGLVAAALTVAYAYFAYYSATLMTEAFYFTVILAALYLTIRLAETGGNGELKLALGLGLTLAVAVLLRQVFLLFIPILFIWLFWARYRRFGRLPIRSTVLASALVAAFILPFTIYNYARFERFVLLNTNAGYAFFWANHPIYGTRFESILPDEMGNYKDLIPANLRDLDEASLDRVLLRQGIDFVTDDPLRYALLSLSRFPAYFKFWPSADSGFVSNVSRVGSFGLMLPLMLLGILFWLRDHRYDGLPKLVESPGALLLVFGLVYTVVHLLSWALIRYRLPVDAVLIIFAGLAVVELVRRFQRWRIPQRHLTDAG
ncbi:MAG: glycosyltransferase family 39 protein [Chloroflexota bacterium]|nr:MAG: glycosyltransferase family 39 protein [Chloroflexota bacterium]